jgi:hypothetical protein
VIPPQVNAITLAHQARVIDDVSREAMAVALANLDFLLERVPPGAARADLVRRREALVNRYTAFLLSQQRRVA